MKKNEEFCCNIGKLKSILCKKGLAVLVMLVIAVIVAFVVYKYFYFLDAYLYTYEFYWLFNINNLKTANVSMFADYFRPMGITTEALPQVILSHFVQNFYLPLTKPILVAATTSAFGIGPGSLFSIVAMLVVGLFSHAIGGFLFGDVVPLLTGKDFNLYQQKLKTPAAVTFPLLFALPWVPISVVALSGTTLKIPCRTALQFMLIGLSIRLFWMLVVPELFQ